jgi:hypothetical protein
MAVESRGCKTKKAGNHWPELYITSQLSHLRFEVTVKKAVPGILRRLALARIDVSEERIASIIRVTILRRFLCCELLLTLFLARRFLSLG